MLQAKRYIQFEAEVRSLPLAMFGGIPAADTGETSGNASDDDEYKIATEDDIMELARILGGG
jgi:hypothetical protein